MARPVGDVRTRFFARVEVDGATGCWQWIGQRNNTGYGHFQTYGNPGVKNHYAHRLAYELIRGAIDDGLVVDHLCRNRLCVNPCHMELVTGAENTRRGRAGRNNAEKTHCAHGHAYTPENTQVYKGSRHCRTCKQARQRAYVQARRI